ncbi:unnamed protein product [Cylindrotheca closterium]|uniref:Uncharacterized protein n=1 Tax=Cylindrotheca closterium TaxID=2856 RepID=A0AAD2CWD9_9STRA|nr:unnamed protein product [Cylindrotheca closterium]
MSQDSIVEKARILAAKANDHKTLESDKLTNLRLGVLAELDQLEKKGRPTVEELVSSSDVETMTQLLCTRAELLMSLQEPEKTKKDLLWLQDLVKLAATNRQKLNSMYKHGEALVAQNKGEEAQELAMKIDEYKAKNNTVPMPQLSFDVCIMLGEAEETMENWEAAKLVYSAMLQKSDEGPIMTPLNNLRC